MTDRHKYPGAEGKKSEKIEIRANPTTSILSPIEIWNGPASVHGHISTATSIFDFSLNGGGHKTI